MRWTLGVVGLLFLAGCGGQDYLLKSADAKMETARQLRIVIAEYQDYTAKALAAQEAQVWADLRASLLLKPVDEARADALIAAVRGKVDMLAAGRANEAQRAVVAARLLAFLDKLSAQDKAIVLRQIDDVEQLRELVERAALSLERK